jgi:predicted dithiol-disulfide oxidoreductase (DUF899 family)
VKRFRGNVRSTAGDQEQLSAASRERLAKLGRDRGPAAVANGTAVCNYGSAPGLEDREGISTFVRDEQGQVFHTNSTYARGIDAVNSTYQLIDLTARGRDEPAEGNPQFWVRRHDEHGR